jgi:hypothetical protein
MSSSKRKCTKYKSMTVSFVSENENCPVCRKEEKIVELKLVVRFFVGYINWTFDYLKIVNYSGVDKAERESKIDGVYSKISDRQIGFEQIVLVLEEYGELRKSFTWK